MTTHELLAAGWSPPHNEDRVRSLTEIRDYVIIVTDFRIWIARTDFYGKLVVELQGHHS